MPVVSLRSCRAKVPAQEARCSQLGSLLASSLLPHIPQCDCPCFQLAAMPPFSSPQRLSVRKSPRGSLLASPTPGTLHPHPSFPGVGSEFEIQSVSSGESGNKGKESHFLSRGRKEAEIQPASHPERAARLSEGLQGCPWCPPILP